MLSTKPQIGMSVEILARYIYGMPSYVIGARGVVELIIRNTNMEIIKVRLPDGSASFHHRSELSIIEKEKDNMEQIKDNKVHQDALTQAFLNAVEDAFKHTYKPANSKEAEALREAYKHVLDDIQIEVQSKLTAYAFHTASIVLDRAVRKVVLENKA